MMHYKFQTQTHNGRIHYALGITHGVLSFGSMQDPSHVSFNLIMLSLHPHPSPNSNTFNIQYYRSVCPYENISISIMRIAICILIYGMYLNMCLFACLLERDRQLWNVVYNGHISLHSHQEFLFSTKITSICFCQSTSSVLVFSDSLQAWASLQIPVNHPDLSCANYYFYFLPTYFCLLDLP